MLDELRILEDDIFHCNKCSSVLKDRLYPMPGFSGSNVKLMVIGINPGPPQPGELDLLKSLNYDYRAHYKIGIQKCLIGKFLEKTFDKLHITWDDIYLTNIIKCATPNARMPNIDEINNCKPYIIRQIRLLKPKNFLFLGKLPIKVFNLDINLMEVKTFNSQIIALPHPTYIRRRRMEEEVLSFLNSVKLKE